MKSGTYSAADSVMSSTEELNFFLLVVWTFVQVICAGPMPCWHLLASEEPMVFLVLALTAWTQVDTTIHTVCGGSDIGTQMTKHCVIC